MIIEREIYLKIKPVIKSPEVVIITGMRRVGKTTLLKYIQERIKPENKVYLDLENPLNQRYFEESNYDKILDNLNLLGFDAKKAGFVFLDEIQFVKNLPSVVKYLSDHYKIKFFLSGSASFYLKNLFSESLAGRKYIFELFPLTFYEFLKLRDPVLDLTKIGKKINKASYELINRYYNEYVEYGGFPGVAAKSSVREKNAALDDIFSSYFQLEVKQLGDFRKLNVIRDLIFLLMERAGAKLDIQKLSTELGVSRETIYDYIAFLESTYFIKLIRPFSRNRDSEIRSMPKFYLCDSGLVNRFSKVTAGALFENAVFCALRAKGEINYYQRKSGVEIDFIVNKKIAYETKINPTVYDVKKVKELCRELRIKNCKVIAKKFSDLESVTYGFTL